MRPISALAAVLSLSALVPLHAQTSCGAPPAVLQSSAPNIFSEQQEQWLGDATVDYLESSYTPVKDPQLNAYVTAIGSRLLAVLPPTKIQFHFTIVESSDVNAFSFAGGRVYLTRKLVASARSEDEVAGVIAHEMGHILSHQFAVEATAEMRRLLGVTSVADRADVYAKFQRLVDAQQHEKHSHGDEESDEKQDEADRVAVYAAAAAGYRPQAYAEFWDRAFFVNGKTGSGLTDFFHLTKPSQKRLRKIQGIIAVLPPNCGATTEHASAAFQAWHELVLRDQAASTDEATPAAEVRLDPPLHTDLEHLRFSPDGKYILAQNESSVYVLTREPFKVLFRFDAENANRAEFSQDSQDILFYTPGLHVEEWNIASQKLIAAHEIVAQQNCLQTMLAPDGRTLACIGPEDRGNALVFALIDVQTGKVVFEKKPWFIPNFGFALSVFLRRLSQDDPDPISWALSTDGNILLVGPGVNRLAFDLRTRTPIKISGAIRDDAYPISYAFVGNDKIAAVNQLNPANSGIFSFPDGHRIEQLKLALGYMKSTSGDQYMLTTGTGEFNTLLADIHHGTSIYRSHGHSLDVFGKSVVAEGIDGSVLLDELGSTGTSALRQAMLPLSPLAYTHAVSISPDGRYLALSAKARAGLWDISTGKQLRLVYSFQNGWWTPDGKFLGQFNARDKQPQRITEFILSPSETRALNTSLEDGSVLESGHLIQWKSKDEKVFDLTVKSPFDNALQWSRHYTEGRPSYTTNYGDDDLIFSYPLLWSIGKDKLRDDSNLKTLAAAVKEKASGRVIEIVNSADGTTRAQTVIEVPRSYDGVDEISRVGDVLYLSAADNRTFVYSLKTGAQLRQLFGYVVAADQPSGIICTSNHRDEVFILDADGKELQHLHLGSSLRYAALRDRATQLIVLTADQRVRRFAVARP